MRNISSIKSQKGITIIEYALIVALLAVIAITTIKTVGTKVNLVFNKAQNKLNGSTQNSGGGGGSDHGGGH